MYIYMYIYIYVYESLTAIQLGGGCFPFYTSHVNYGEDSYRAEHGAAARHRSSLLLPYTFTAGGSS